MVSIVRVASGEKKKFDQNNISGGVVHAHRTESTRMHLRRKFRACKQQRDRIASLSNSNNHSFQQRSGSAKILISTLFFSLYCLLHAQSHFADCVNMESNRAQRQHLYICFMLCTLSLCSSSTMSTGPIDHSVH